MEKHFDTGESMYSKKVKKLKLQDGTNAFHVNPPLNKYLSGV